jgi:hypothetical protein
VRGLLHQDVLEQADGVGLAADVGEQVVDQLEAQAVALLGVAEGLEGALDQLLQAALVLEAACRRP